MPAGVASLGLVGLMRACRVCVALALCASLLAAALATGASGAKRKTYFPSNCSNARYKPKHLIAACGDAGVRVNRIHWKHYGARSARGGGTAVVNICEPNCAEGNFERDPVRVRLSRPRYCRAVGIRLFTRLKLTYPGARPGGAPSSLHYPFPCSLLEQPSG
jgi:hypothetical protein